MFRLALILHNAKYSAHLSKKLKNEIDVGENVYSPSIATFKRCNYRLQIINTIKSTANWLFEGTSENKFAPARNLVRCSQFIIHEGSRGRIANKIKWTKMLTVWILGLFSACDH